MNTEYWIEKLELLPHPEGGYYKETYRANETIPQNGLPDRFSSDRSFSTAIYFLIPAGKYSRLHRIQADETWHFYTGIPLEIVMIDNQGQLKTQLLGTSFDEGQVFQFTVPHGWWFGSRTIGKAGFSLVGCTVAPGFDFADFEMGDKTNLIQKYPHLSDIISSLT